VDNTKDAERKARYKVGQYVLHTMFPLKEKPEKIVMIDQVRFNDSGKAEYWLLYAQLDLDSLSIKKESGGSGCWAEECFAEIKDPVIKLIAEKQMIEDEINKLSDKIKILRATREKIDFALKIIAP